MKYSWQLKLGIFLIISSFLVYFVKFIILGDPENTYFYVFNALGFLPINVLLVTLVLNELLSVRARRERMEKLNMVIGTFFSEVGTDLLHMIAQKDTGIARVADSLKIREEWREEDFERTRELFSLYRFHAVVERQDLESMKVFLKEKRNFLLRLMETRCCSSTNRLQNFCRLSFTLPRSLKGGEISSPSRTVTSLTCRRTSNGFTVSSVPNGCPT